MQYPTSNDVAKKAGVSRAAVSAVLNRSKTSTRVSEQTRQRILAAAAELGYSPNPVAQSLRHRRSGTIAYVYRSLSDSLLERSVPYQLGRLIMSVAVEQGYQVIEVNSAENPSNDTLRLLQSRRVSGVIMGWPKSSLEVSLIVGAGIPVVQVMKPQPADGSLTITVDSSPGITSVVDHLVSLGHERIAYLGNNDAHPVERARFACFREALAAHGIQIQKRLIKLGDLSLENSRQLTHDLLKVKNPPSALIMIDSSVLGGLRALYECNLRVPDDITVVSTDDLLASHLYPALTSVVQPLEKIAEYAVSLIKDTETNLESAERSFHTVFPSFVRFRSSSKELSPS